MLWWVWLPEFLEMEHPGGHFFVRTSHDKKMMTPEPNHFSFDRNGPVFKPQCLSISACMFARSMCVCKFLCKILRILKIKFQAAWAAWNKITPARGPKKCGVQETNVPDTSNSSYRSGWTLSLFSSNTFYIDLNRESHKIFTQDLAKGIPDIFKILTQGPREEDFNRISTRSPPKNL